MTTQVSGRRSPMWAVWSRMDIPCPNGEHYLARLRLIQTPWFGVYIHDIFEADGDRDPHNHPWPFVSIVLRGWYTELVFPMPRHSLDGAVFRDHRRFSAHRMDQEKAHRIVKASPGLKTLILTGKRNKAGWGFFTGKEYIPWDQYERMQAEND